ncbi:MAG: hypothetical protein R2751_10260 [Bacteroidales bacterium]
MKSRTPMPMNTIEGIHYQSGRAIRLGIRGERIERVEPLPGKRPDLPLLAPGLTDLQVNGYGGVDFNTLPFREEDVQAVVRGLAGQGVTSFLPTLVTNRSEAIHSGIRTLLGACASYPEVRNALEGIHLEGPFLSREEGPRGAHDPGLMQAPDWDLFRDWQREAQGRIRILTLSPEWENAPEFIRRCSADGTLVATGHTAATPEQIAEAGSAVPACQVTSGTRPTSSCPATPTTSGSNSPGTSSGPR